MLPFLQEIYKQFTEVHAESYHNQNTADKVVYPYLTYDFDSEEIERNVDGFYIDVDVFDNIGSFTRIFELEGKLKDHFKDKVLLTEHNLFRFNFLRSTGVPTGDKLLRRRNLQIYCKLDWRNK
ncbi:hypothetical protein MUB24_03435 [Lederbergia sp. NSJ-179]|uniref:hypothetical protein n=1 Tax=Lederbergia sp. NSJ-179 TaxID=2931402 RepID=UPI001FD3C74A|nr:hypothetical protein [Lederbergia sp. NSJ-179]MCJ7839980.1 hypothetical protein [Lederbergia sp. NSJ-179]